VTSKQDRKKHIVLESLKKKLVLEGSMWYPFVHASWLPLTIVMDHYNNGLFK